MFSDSRCKNACKMHADLCPCFHQSPTRPNFCRSRIKVCPILCRLRTKLCPNFGCSCARLCPISFAPCPFPNLAGTLYSYMTFNHIFANTLVSVASFPLVVVVAFDVRQVSLLVILLLIIYATNMPAKE